jgi:hypothetical protein
LNSSGDKKTLKELLCEYLEIVKIEIDPCRVLYSQCCIKPTFTNGKLVEETIEKLVNGELSPKEIKPIRVWTSPDGKMYSLDNRRLYAFKEAIRRGAGIRNVLVENANWRRNLKKELEFKKRTYKSQDWSVVEIKEDC